MGTAVLIGGLVVAAIIGVVMLTRRTRGRTSSASVRMPGVDVTVQDGMSKGAHIEKVKSRKGGVRAEAEDGHGASIRDADVEGDIVARAAGPEKKTPQ